jgi:predicted ArsR family transcriptional regulator
MGDGSVNGIAGGGKAAEERLEELRENMERQHLKDTAALLSALEEKFGPDVKNIVKAATTERTFKQWQEISAQADSHTVEDLMRILWEPLHTRKGYAFTLEKQGNGVLLRCTSCPTHTMAKELGITGWASCLVCSGDPYIVKGFNDRIGFEHINKLMEGDDCCLQYYYMKK